jgi:hypothetical protein
MVKNVKSFDVSYTLLTQGNGVFRYEVNGRCWRKAHFERYAIYAKCRPNILTLGSICPALCRAQLKN